MTRPARHTWGRLTLLALAAALIMLALWRLQTASDGVIVTPVDVAGAPATVFAPVATKQGPVVVIAHGFAGSQQLMHSFAYAFARNGYVAVTFDLPGHGWRPDSAGRFTVALVALVIFNYVALAWAIDAFLTSYAPGLERAPLILAMFVGALPFFLADEWMTRGPRPARLAYAASKLAFVASLAVAIALDFQRLFFLIIITPFILAYFIVYGLISRWTYQATGHPFIAGFANALAVAWAIAATFPLLAR